jgi:glycosyltransferase involved in cell wall biosynthesis
MLINQQIVYVGNDWFTENKTSSHHIAEILAQTNSVLYIEGAGQRVPQATARDFRKILYKLKVLQNGVIKVGPGMHVFSPVTIPFHKSASIRAINGWILEKAVNRACRQLGFSSPVLWIILPHFSSLIGKLNEKGVVYYCVDEYAAQPGVDSESVRLMEDRLLKSANVVFTVSEPLFSRKHLKAHHTYLSLHGVDFDHFRKSNNDHTLIPSDIIDIPKPIAVFVGLIERWVDLDLIEYLAHLNKHVSFLFIGRLAQSSNALNKCSNVYFLGQRPYRALPRYLHHVDACLLPYKLNDQVLNSNPKKLREYLATGKPVVSVRVKEVERYSELVYIANDYQEFSNFLNLAIKENSPTLREARIAAMKKESWESRVAEISCLASRHLKLDY